MSDVVITGLGAVTCLGDSVPALWAGLTAATPPAPPYAVTGFPGTGRASAMALAAVRQAVTDARLSTSDVLAAGLVAGTTLGDVDLLEDGATEGPYRLTEMLAAELGCTGPTHSISTACSAGVYAVSTAADLVDAGVADVVLACGSDCLSAVSRAMLERFELLDPVRCRPFDAERVGMVPGEGAGAVVVESAAHARARGARAYATVESSGWSADAHHPTAPAPDGERFTAAIADAVCAAGGPPGVLLPHRAGIAANDAIETTAAATALGAHVADTPAYGIKAMLGHPAGAAGVLACVAGALMLRAGTVPPNANVSTPDPDCVLPVPLATVPLPRPRVLVTATGFGGSNAALVLGAA
jgi:3-oxoacyl-[acyl-carrier-protein] synthase II